MQKLKITNEEAKIRKFENEKSHFSKTFSSAVDQINKEAEKIQMKTLENNR